MIGRQPDPNSVPALALTDPSTRFNHFSLSYLKIVKREPFKLNHNHGHHIVAMQCASCLFIIL